jgi:long-chain acyl-CoA synthetase
MIKVLDNVYDLVTLNMEQRFSERVALRFYDKETDEVTAVHYKDYARDIRRAVSYFQSTIPDIKGKKICLLNKNSYEYAVNTFGIILAGGVLVLLNQHKSWDELSYELGLVDPAAILTDGDDYGTKEQLQAAYGSILRPMDGFRAYEPVAEMPRCIGHDDLMILMFTSGTTGRSKGVMLSERNMCASLHTYSEVAENWITNRLPAGQKLPLSHMTLLPLFHMACFVCVMSYPPAGWALNLCGDIRDFYRDLGLIHSDVMASAPMLVETIYNDMKRGRVSRLNGLWDLCCSSAALDPKMLLELAQNGFVVNQCYGMTETFGDGILNFTQVEKHMSAVGKPDDHVQYKLDETGEICIKGDCVMLGYYKDPEATAEAIDADGWFHTGDLARMDEEGFYYITGRKKNLIILASGENVSPEELEKKLALCPAITECIVKEKGQKICAVIYCPEDKQEEVRAFVIEVNRSLPLYKRISAVEFTVEPLPRNALGKLLRK